MGVYVHKSRYINDSNMNRMYFSYSSVVYRSIKTNNFRIYLFGIGREAIRVKIGARDRGWGGVGGQ